MRVLFVCFVKLPAVSAWHVRDDGGIISSQLVNWACLPHTACRPGAGQAAQIAMASGATRHVILGDRGWQGATRRVPVEAYSCVELRVATPAHCWIKMQMAPVCTVALNTPTGCLPRYRVRWSGARTRGHL
jgi:hypothetical protein